MTDQNKPHPEGHSPKQDMSKMNEAQLARQLRDANLSKEEYESLMEDLKKRRHKVLEPERGLDPHLFFLV